MKNSVRLNGFIVAALVVMMAGLFSCKKKSNDSINDDPVNLGTIVVKGEITSDQRWTKDKHYLLSGPVYVVSGVTLTIDPGTIIKGDKDSKGTLVIEQGAKLMAVGTVTSPIVFTSNQPQGQRNYGDWGGVVLCGKAPSNNASQNPVVEGGLRSHYGGTDANDNSGSLQYVRIEFGGVALTPNNEINGLSLYSVGAGTTIDHVQVSYSGDDSYEWFGGTVNCKYLVAHRGVDDDFDTDNGFSGKCQFLAGIRDQAVADPVSGSKAFESDNDAASSTNMPQTKAVFSNVTALIAAPNTSAASAYFVAGAHIRRNSSISILNSVIMGYPTGLFIDGPLSGANANNGDISFKSNIVAGIYKNSSNMPGGLREIIYSSTQLGGNGNNTSASAMSSDSSVWSNYSGPVSWFYAKENGNSRYTYNDDVRLQNPYNLTNPSLLPISSSPISYNSKTLPAYMTTGGTDPFSNGKKYPFNPTKPINTDTTNRFANYNAPDVVPNFADAKVSDSFFTKVNYVGAFAGTLTTADNWLLNWTNFDPNNANYGDQY